MHRGSRSHAVMRALRHEFLIDHSELAAWVSPQLETYRCRGLKFLVQYIAPGRVSTLLSQARRWAPGVAGVRGADSGQRTLASFSLLIPFGALSSGFLRMARHPLTMILPGFSAIRQLSGQLSAGTAAIATVH